MYTKKVLALLLAVLLVVSLVPAIALAAYTAPSEFAAAMAYSTAWPISDPHDPTLDAEAIPTGAYLYGLFDGNYQPIAAPDKVAGYTKVDKLADLKDGTWTVITVNTFNYAVLLPAADKPAVTEAPKEEAPAEEPAAPAEEPAAPAEEPAVEIPATGTATPSKDKLFIGDTEVPVVAAYKIGNENYFKLRDIAALVDTADIEYDKATKVITVILGKAYTVDEANPTSTVAPSADATYNKSKNTIEIQYVSGDPVPADLTAYKIDNSNYFRLRDLQEIFAFTVEWNEETKAAIIFLDNDGSDDDAAGADVPPETVEEPVATEAPKAAEKTAKEILDAMKEGDDLPATLKVDGKELAITWYNAGQAYSGKLADGVYGGFADEGIGAKIGLEMGVSADFVTWTPSGWCDASTVFAAYMPAGSKTLIIWHK